MQNNCKAPQCEFSQRWKKCVKPNAYNEALAWCKRNKIAFATCKQNYNSDDAKREACKRYEEKLRMSKPKRTKTLRSSAHKHVFVKDVYSPNTAASKITKFIKARVMQRSESLKSRINYFNSVQYYIRNVPYYNCLTPKKYIDKNNKTHNGFDFDSTLKLVRQIGTRSAYGTIYQTAARNNILSVATKLMPINKRNKQEVILNTTVTKLVINRVSKHFLISYRTFKCIKKPTGTDYPRIIRKKEYYITLNELAHGDLYDLCKKRDFLANDEVILNIAFQCFLAIYTFHKLGYCHNDCHWGNFLYQVSKQNSGYFEYIIDGKSYYLKNCGYNMMIYDFGLAKPKTASRYHRRILDDYRRMLNAFKNEAVGGWIKGIDLPTSRVSTFINNLNTILLNSVSKMYSENYTFKDHIIPRFLNSPIPGLFTDRLPNNTLICNADHPFSIDEHIINIPMINPLSSSLSAS